MTDTPSSPRPRGGQPGNTNSLKHGFYTRRVPGLKASALEALDTEFPGLEEEIFVLRAYIRRVLEWSAACHEYHEGLLLLRTLCMAFSTLARLTREHRAMIAQPIDTLANLRQAHTGVAQIQDPQGAYREFLDTLIQHCPTLRAEDYFSAVEDLLPTDTFDSQPPLPFPTPVTLCAPQPASPLSPADVTADTPDLEFASPPPDSIPGSRPNQISNPVTEHDVPYLRPKTVASRPLSPAPQPVSRCSTSELGLDPFDTLAYRITRSLMHRGPGHSIRFPAKLVDRLPKFNPAPDPPLPLVPE